MLKLKRIWAIILLLAIVLPAQAQFKFGPRLGVAVNSLHFNESIADKDNLAGFTGGLQLEFTVPLIGIGGDISALYVHRSTSWMEDKKITSNSDYIDIPLNLKYKLNIIGIGKIVKPYVFTGPSFSFLCSKKIINDLKKKSCDIAWNFGFGLELIDHLQLGASYGLGLTSALEFIGTGPANAPHIEGKNRYWTITAAWLF